MSLFTRLVLSCGLFLGIAIALGKIANGYEEPVHLSLTIWLAVTAGFSDNDAFQLGRFDQATDDDSDTTPMAPHHFKERGLYHAFDGPQAVRKLEAQVKCDRGTITIPQFRGVGHYHHALEDQFAHRCCGAVLGQLLVGAGPDKPWYAPRDFVEMVNRKFEALLELRRKCKAASSTEITVARSRFEQAKALLDRWASEAFEFSAEDEGNQARWQDLIRSLYGADYVKYAETYVNAYRDLRRTPPTPGPSGPVPVPAPPSGGTIR